MEAEAHAKEAEAYASEVVWTELHAPEAIEKGAQLEAAELECKLATVEGEAAKLGQLGQHK